MHHQRGRVLDGPATKSPKLSFDTFLKNARDHQADIKTRQNIVLSAQKLFHERINIWPDQCDRIIDSLDRINEPIHGLLATAERLPMAVSPLRFPLIRSLYYFDKLVDELTLLITLFRTTCQTSSKQVMTQRREILHKFDLLVQGGEDILQNVDILLDQARFINV